ncbi:MAG: endo alpha-1,4 polygalactosaminidase [Spirochaetales bacterium]|nr:endo alpha-1,4 polygalactosaminidase [Spirochaetales bacterium]
MKPAAGLIPLLLILFSCCSIEEEPVKPAGNDSAIAVYIQAYQENYEPDSFSLIMSEAENAYILMDPFDDEFLSAAEMETLHTKGNDLSAYISIGTGEDWRSDFDELEPYLAEKQWGDWAGEYYVSRIEPGLVVIMKARIDRAANLGFDWIEFDNMDWIFNEETREEYSLVSDEADGLAYIEELRVYAVSRGLKCMAKNRRTGAESFDGITFESYTDDISWWAAEDLKVFLEEGKPGLIVHYGEWDRTSAFAAYESYMDSYGRALSFICEVRSEKGYIHFND